MGGRGGVKGHMKRAVFRYVEAELYDYPYTKRELEELRAAIIDEGPDPGTVVVGRDKTRFSDPTYTKAQRLLTNRRLARMEETVRAIERVLTRLPAEKKRLVELKYWDGRYTDKGIIQQISISERTYYRWRQGIIHGIGIEMGLVNAAEEEEAVG